MKFLDINGVIALWNKIKEYIGTETKKYLPLNGGGVITEQATILTRYSGTYKGGSVTFESNTIPTIGTQPYKIKYAHENIHIYINQNKAEHEYTFDLQKLINDGYLIEK